MAVPYPPSWLDRLTAWVDRLPVPPWGFYAALATAGYLAATRDIVDSRPTWPWQPSTVRGLATAILLPIALWLLQVLLQRLLHL